MGADRGQLGDGGGGHVAFLVLDAAATWFFLACSIRVADADRECLPRAAAPTAEPRCPPSTWVLSVGCEAQ